MDEAIDYGAVIAQLQLENEMLRNHMRAFTEVRQVVYTIPNLLEDLWHKATSNKYALLLGVMIIYWAVSIGLLIYDRWPKGA